ncbi:interferon regulatory factor 9 [Dunckerocampus dactyliophorus]|uniref:interferon regulatory factor 9 n=1 Tax=Dunckerocampus dactyliophorus TaxID=161453 RepID=UPI002404B7E5|nr:interferon regulatory factor 9 [Dunckerocampus dactyliophorus]
MFLESHVVSRKGLAQRARSRPSISQRSIEHEQPSATLTEHLRESLLGTMAAGKMRCTRKLRSWIVEQVSSGKYPGLVWDDEDKTMFRIPWKHAGKQDFRKDEDAAIFKAWAEFKGKTADCKPAAWKTRLRCALNKSPEFSEVPERAQLDISEPYKVYRLVPISEQRIQMPKRKCREKASRRWKRRRRNSSSSSSSSSSETESDDITHIQEKRMEDVKVEPVCGDILDSYRVPQADDAVQLDGIVQEGALSEIRLDVRIDENVPPPLEDEDSLHVSVHYLGQEVLNRQIHGPDVRVLYAPPSPVPPTTAPDVCFPRIHLPEPASPLLAGKDLEWLHRLLSHMAKGVALTSTAQGVYGMRFCQARVFWMGPHMPMSGLHKMERNSEPVLLFSKDAFKQQLDNFRLSRAEAPQSSFTLCFGEEISSSEEMSGKHIIVKVTLPWAEQQVQSTRILESFTLLTSPLDEITLNLVAVPIPELTG